MKAIKSEFTPIYILANGVVHEAALKAIKGDMDELEKQTRLAPIVIAADGGAKYASLLNLEIDYLIGDMDSFPTYSLNLSERTQLIRFPTEKDATDLELALRLVCDLIQSPNDEQEGSPLQPHQIIILGATGGRLDMTFSNLYLLAQPDFASLRIEVWAENEVLSLLKPPHSKRSLALGSRVSLIPLENAHGIRTKGLKYPLNNETLYFASSRGVSNEVCNTDVQIEWDTGLMICIQDRTTEAT